MTNYLGICRKYLKSNRKRSIITIIGVVITVVVLYAGLNLAYATLLNQREATRKEADYDFVLLTESRAQAESIAEDDRIERAYVGTYTYVDWYSDMYSTDGEYVDDVENDDTVNGNVGSMVSSEDEEGTGETETVYDNALFVCVKQPYRMNSIMLDMEATYGVTADMNNMIFSLYFQGDADEGNSIVILLLIVLLVSYIFAIFAVGIIRNTIQMFTMEQVKDYGILRCVGATKRQLKNVIALMGVMLEGSGIIAGILLGGVTSMVIGSAAGIGNSGFHLIPVIPVLIAYFGDLYFVIRENCKLITGMSPINAVRGQFKIKKESIKRRSAGLMGRVFGVEGEYARKNVLRNRRRFLKTVSGITISITAMVAVFSISAGLDTAEERLNSRYGDYPAEIVSVPGVAYGYDIDSSRGELPMVEQFEEFAAKKCVREAKKVYRAQVYVTDPEELRSHQTDDYKENSMTGSAYAKLVSSLFNSGIEMEGLDEDDMKLLEDKLVDGTIDTGSDGVVLVAGGSDYIAGEYEETTLYDPMVHFDMYDYKVGDTITIVNSKEYEQRVDELFHKDGSDSENVERNADTMNALEDIYNDMIEEGRTTTYTIKGIVDMGDRIMTGTVVYVPLDTYFRETGYDENDISGMKYKIDPSNLSTGDYDMIYSGTNSYMVLLSELNSFTKVLKGLVLAVIFVFSLSAVNIINSTAGNLQMRRKEFAQLRVIGMSRKRLMKTVMLEGVMVVVIANIIGDILGSLIYRGLYSYMNMIVELRFTLSYGSMLVALLVSCLLIFGSIYVPLRRLPKGMAEDLMVESEI